MQLLHTATDLPGPARPVCLAIGMFDGVHLGHQQVIRQAAADAGQHEGAAVVVTFDRHPAVVLAPERAPGLIYPLAKKLDVIGGLGVDAALLLHFDHAFSQQPAEEFIHRLVRDFGRLRSISVGATFTFGHRRGGNVDLLRRLGTELGFQVHGLGAVALDGDRVSSTRIREAVRAGEFNRAGELLGREYTLCGTVVAGDQLGRQLGFPTANLDVAGLALPPHGVYAVHASVDGQRHRAVVNLGVRPTLRDATPQLRVEAHLLDFTGDLYGRTLELSFVQQLRPELRFPSLEALKAQIAEDIAAARRLFVA